MITLSLIKYWLPLIVGLISTWFFIMNTDENLEIWAIVVMVLATCLPVVNWAYALFSLILDVDMLNSQWRWDSSEKRFIRR